MIPKTGTALGRTPAEAQFDVALELPGRSNARLPALMLQLNEDRTGGWRGVVRVNPRLVAADDALQALLQDGLVPGTAVVVKLLVSGRAGSAGSAIRTWPSVVTSVRTAGSEDVNAPDAVCTVTLRDPLTHLADRPVWAAFVDCPLGELLGGVLSCAAGCDGRPTRQPVLPGLPEVRIKDELRDEVADVAYAIAAGEQLGLWLDRVFSRLGVRMSMAGDPVGTLHLTLCDGVPSRTSLNGDGGLDMTLDPDREASATNLSLSRLDVKAPSPLRGGLLDDAAGAGPERFGPAGAVGTVLMEPNPSADEAAHRAGFRHANRRLAETRATFASCQPGLLPGRVVNLRTRDPVDRGSGPFDGPGPGNEPPLGGEPRRASALLGADRWQVADVAHLCLKARYWNRATFEKTGLAWRPELPREQGAVLVSGVVDDGVSTPGEPVRRDRLGRIPIRLAFTPAPSSGEGSSSPSAPGDGSSPPRVPLAPVAPGAGDLHGFVADHRQGDWCRIAVVNPLLAEIIGYGHRDDRQLGEGVLDATVGIVVREGLDDWHGLLFRADGEPD